MSASYLSELHCRSRCALVDVRVSLAAEPSKAEQQLSGAHANAVL